MNIIQKIENLKMTKVTKIEKYSTIDFRYFIDFVLNNMTKTKENYVLVKTMTSYYNKNWMYYYGCCKFYSIYEVDNYEKLVRNLGNKVQASDITNNMPFQVKELNLYGLGIQKEKGPRTCNPIYPTDEMMDTAKFIQDNSEIYINTPYYYSDEFGDMYDDNNPDYNSSYPIEKEIQLFSVYKENVLNSLDYIFVLNKLDLIQICIELLDSIDKVIQKEREQEKQILAPLRKRAREIRVLDSLNGNEKKVLIDYIKDEIENEQSKFQISTPFLLTKGKNYNKV